VELVVKVYRLTESFPSYELYGLTSQMRRAAVSVPSNVAEGVARRGTSERRQFLYIARGSLSELETQIIIAARLGYFETEKQDSLLETSGKVGAMLNGLLRQ
jgi:four helix bundle protein